MIIKYNVKGKSVPGKKKSNTDSDTSSDGLDEGRRSSISIESSIALMYQSNLMKSIYDAVPRYDEDGDIQKLLEFIDKIESYFEMIELISSSQIQAATLKLTGTTNLLWHHHKQMYDRESANRIKTWDGLKNLLKRNKITSEHER